MDVNADFKDVLSALSAANARFLLVGAHAVIHHTEPRYTKDFDLWVEATAKNARRVWKALLDFGAPLKHVRLEDFQNPSMVYQIGMEPCRIDITMGLEGLNFPSAWRKRVRSNYGGVPIFILSRADLIKTKRATGRPQDMLDIERLVPGTRRRRRRKRKR